jgi:hypothetical protein
MRSRARIAQVRISASELANLGSAPVLLVPPPGPNKAIIYLDAVASVKLHGDTALDIGNCQIGYTHADADALLSSALFASYVADSEVIHYAPSIALAGLLLDVEQVENEGLYLHQVAASAVPGSVVAHSLAAGGADYEEDDVLTIAGGATFTVLTVDGGGAVLTYELTTAGSTVEVGAAQATTGGAGTGATITVTEIDASEQHAEVNLKVFYDVFTIDS